MTIITFNKKELERKSIKITKEIENKISMLGFPVEASTNEELSIDVTPNRPDVLSLSGFARVLNFHFEKKKPYDFKINKPEKNYEVIIDKSIEKVKPYTKTNEKGRLFTCCAIVKSLKFDDEKIKEIIDIQEKLHLTLGRKRKKMAIGIYPLEQISLPITFSATPPENIKFIPLESNREMNGRHILSGHPAGREYAYLLDSQTHFPVFTDSKGDVLSMPPIINSQKTGRINKETKELFIECSGFNLPILKKTINIITTALADLGGEIYQMRINDELSKPYTTPDLEPQKLEFKIEDINKTLGLELKEAEIKKLLEKSGIIYEKNKALIPAYRTDILHWIDLTEEIMIAYGCENFQPEIPKISTIAEEDKISLLKKSISNILTGLEMLECSSFHLSTLNNIKIIYPNIKDLIEVQDSKTEYSILRPDLTSSILKILSENTNSQYPQKIFELGRTFSLNNKKETGIEETEKLCVSLAFETANFTISKQILDYLCRMLGKEFTIVPHDKLIFIEGRSAKILIDNKEAGYIGEVHPRLLKELHIKMPVALFELDIESLGD